MNDDTRPQYLHLQRQWERPLDLLVILAALATIPIVILQERQFDHLAVSVIDWVIWAIFLVEYVFGITVVKSRNLVIHFTLVMRTDMSGREPALVPVDLAGDSG